MQSVCPVCLDGESSFYASIDGYRYFRCGTCGSLHIDTATLEAIDAGESVRVYDESYWREELKSARERSTGESLVRAGEAILYSRRPVRRFLDVGTGPGYLLDQLAKQFPGCKGVFHGVESFPPKEHSAHPDYLVGDVGDLKETFDAGVCIEVIEHLTPRMLDHLIEGLARISNPDSLWLFNTSLAERTLEEDLGYLDPLRRGHIVSYSLQGLRHVYEKYGFALHAVPGKNYAFIAEFRPSHTIDDFEIRFTQPLAENEALLGESGLMLQAAFEAARSSFFQAQYRARTEWALELNTELEGARRLYASLQEEHEGIARWAQSLDEQLRGCSSSREDDASFQQMYNQVLGSRSWKITKPLRAVSHWANGSRRNGSPVLPQVVPGQVANEAKRVVADEVIILAGGLGTRLRGVVGELPKALAPVAGRPFLAWLLDMLCAQGIRRVILATGYQADHVETALGSSWKGMDIVYSRESEPRGTGGAIALAMQMLEGDACFVLNGDTYLALDYVAFDQCVRGSGAHLGVALSQEADVSRYGAVHVDHDRVTGFVEKGRSGPGYINAGVYWMGRSARAFFPSTTNFSFEADVLVPMVACEPVAAFTKTSDFIDIGVPEDYQRAQGLFASVESTS